MPDTPPTSGASAPSGLLNEPTAQTRRVDASGSLRTRVEIALLLAIGVIPPLIDATAAVFDQGAGASSQPAEFREDALWLILRSVQVAAPAVYIAWRSADDRRNFGTPSPSWNDQGFVPPRITDVAWAILLFLAVSIAE